MQQCAPGACKVGLAPLNTMGAPQDDTAFYKEKYGEEVFNDSNSDFEAEEEESWDELDTDFDEDEVRVSPPRRASWGLLSLSLLPLLLSNLCLFSMVLSYPHFSGSLSSCVMESGSLRD